MIRSKSIKEKHRFSRLIRHGKNAVPSDLFPLPVQTDESLCRDAFLRQVLGSNKRTGTLEDLTSTKRPSTTAIVNISTSSQNLSDVEPQFMPSDIRSHSSLSSTDSKVLAMDLNERMLMRYRYLLSDIGNQSICYQIEHLKAQLTIIGDVCCGKLDEMYKVFNWSISDHLAMFETRRNTVYLDILERVQTERELDKMKLKVDINEIIRLLDAIQDDVKTKTDPCQGSLRLLKHTQHDIMKYLTAPFEKLQSEHDDLTLALYQCKPTPLVNSLFATRRHFVKMKRLDCDYLHPIEVRYSINLANDAVEQANFVYNLAYKAITDELAQLELLSIQDLYVWQSCQLSYSQTIEEYKIRIEKLQLIYDEDMDRTENELQEMRNAVQKCKDDLLFYQEQVQFFQSEVERTKDIIAQEQLKPKKLLSKQSLSIRHQGKRKVKKRKM
ncbi:uncharacterized protein [Drosophila tropicalis]|uniref:uncharacterized protein n=1 Tax=Drosophila tropicalis TaxID=46794 RepID=UPI0035AC18B1